MKAILVSEPPAHGDWLYELKFDGFRAVAVKNGRKVGLYSRNAKDFSARFPEIVAAIGDLPIESTILDGEIVAVDESGRPSFQLLQNLETRKTRPTLAYYVFDMLNRDGRDLMASPLHLRRSALREVLSTGDGLLRFSAEIDGEPRRVLELVRMRGLEGIIGKERDSYYEPNRRSASWIKLKCVTEQEMVIGGYTRPAGTRTHFGALMLGYYDRKRLRFAGKVETGFDTLTLKLLHKKLEPLKRDRCPFEDIVGVRFMSREMSSCQWVEPKLVCQVRFAEWTRDGKLRQPVYMGLREDKDARETIREGPNS